MEYTFPFGKVYSIEGKHTINLTIYTFPFGKVYIVKGKHHFVDGNGPFLLTISYFMKGKGPFPSMI
jgi:hypothetical protein